MYHNYIEYQYGYVKIQRICRYLKQFEIFGRKVIRNLKFKKKILTSVITKPTKDIADMLLNSCIKSPNENISSKYSMYLKDLELKWKE